jgi:hypothetical protein
LFSFHSVNWAKTPFRDYITFFDLISSTQIDIGTPVSCILDYLKYTPEIGPVQEPSSSINLVKDEFMGDWNFTILPH